MAEGIYEAEEDYRNDGNSRMGRRRAAVGERDVMYDSCYEICLEQGIEIGSNSGDREC